MALTDPLRGAPVVVVDVESTGGGRKDRVIEVGVVRFDALLQSEPRVVLSQLVDPGMPIHPAATRVHGLRDVDVRRSPRWPDVASIVQRALSTSAPTICAYGASFDHRMLTAEGLQLPELAQWLDPLRLCKRVDKEGPHTLTAACERRGIETGNHRAAADALATARLLVAMLHELPHLPNTIGELVEWLAAPASKVRAAPPPRRMWRVFGGVGGQMWLGGPLQGRRHDGGAWWVLSAGKATSYWSADEAARAAKWSGGTVVEVDRQVAERAAVPV